ncbi:hypothetical protein B296_00058944, partial [Ensete ventricosum]
SRGGGDGFGRRGGRGLGASVGRRDEDEGNEEDGAVIHREQGEVKKMRGATSGSRAASLAGRCTRSHDTSDGSLNDQDYDSSHGRTRTCVVRKCPTSSTRVLRRDLSRCNDVKILHTHARTWTYEATYRPTYRTWAQEGGCETRGSGEWGGLAGLPLASNQHTQCCGSVLAFLRVARRVD